ncbi:MAG: MFS transporter [Actinomycetota bacterium]|nr:MFS transporter [Actinomycetota bacterium]
MSGLLILLWAERDAFGAAGIGYVNAAVAIGAVVGAFAQAAWGHRSARRRTFAVSFLIAGAPRFIAIALPLPLWAVVLVWVISGVGAGAINPIVATAEYETVPRRLQARVLAAIGAIAWAGIPFGPLLGAASVGAVGFVPTIWAFALLYLAATMSPFFGSSWSLLDLQASQARGAVDLE